MKRLSYVSVGIYLLRILVGGIFVYSSILKLQSPQSFADSIASFQLLPYALINISALALPFFEISCGLLLISGVLLRVGLVGVLLLLFIFAIALTTALLRGLSVNCGCFGSDSVLNSSPTVALLRDLLLLIVTFLLYRNYLLRKNPNLESRS